MATQAMTAAGQPVGVKHVARNWLGVGALVIVAVIVGGLIGWAVSGGPAQMSDNAVVDRNMAAWTANDKAAMADGYAPNAVFQDVDLGDRYEGVAKIAAYVAYLDGLGFVVERTGATTRYGDWLITPLRYGRPGDWSNAVGVTQVKDGKITYHTAFTLPPAGG